MNDSLALIIVLIFFVGCIATIYALVTGFAQMVKAVLPQDREAQLKQEQQRLDQITEIKLGTIREMDALSRQTADEAKQLFETGTPPGTWR